MGRVMEYRQGCCYSSGSRSKIAFVHTLIRYIDTSQCCSSTISRQAKDNNQKQQQGHLPSENMWTCKTPYNFTGCLAHMDLTYWPAMFKIIHIAGILDHNKDCRSQYMT